MGIENIIATCGEWIKEHHTALIVGVATAAGFYFLSNAAIEMARMGDVVHPKQLELGKVFLSGSVGLLSYNGTTIIQNLALFERLRSRKRKKTLSWQDIKRYYPGIPIGITYALLFLQPVRQAIENIAHGESSFDDKRFLLKAATQVIGLSILAKVAAPFLDKRTSDAQGHSTSATFEEWAGNHERAAVLHQKACDTLDSRLSRLALGRCYAKQGNYARAIQETHRAFMHKQLDDPLFEYFERSRIRRWLEYGRVVREHNYLKKAFERDASVKEGLELAVLYYSLGHDEKAASVLDRLAKHQRDNRDLQLLYAIALGETDQEEQARQQYTLVLEELIRKGRDFHLVGESVNAVFEYTASDFIKEVVIFKKGRPEAIAAEVRIVQAITNIITDHQKYHVPQVLTTIQQDDVSYLVMKREQGKLLEEVSDTSTYVQAADFLAYLHVCVPESTSMRGRTDILRSLNERLQNPDLDLEERVAEEIRQHFSPVYEAVKDMPWGINCDAHPGNFMLLKEGGILALDKEDKGVIPVGFDVANLCIGRQDMDNIIDAYWESYHKYEGHITQDAREAEHQQFRLGCLNSIIYRAIAFLSAWSSPKRPTMHQRRAWIMEQAIQSIDQIRERYKEYYHQFQDSYAHLHRAFAEIKLGFSRNAPA